MRQHLSIVVAALLLGAPALAAAPATAPVRIVVPAPAEQASTAPSSAVTTPLPRPEDCALLLIGLGCLGIAMRSRPARSRRA